mmetsp:Transcript_58447/g.155510  ORF Transcript_58447/g.155510 Transcript_58447/m.155510 type:complete len:526 (-) Transcript_58447:163-1740(-)
MELTPWHTLAAALWTAMGCGFAYSFSTFSPALQAQYNLTENNLSTIGIATTAVGIITFSAGLFTDRVGARAAILVGGFINAVGWLIYGIIAYNDVKVASPTLLFLFLGVTATYGAALVTGAVFMIIVKNFDPNQGRALAIGIAKSWVGVATGFTTAVFIGFFPSENDDDPQNLKYLFFLSGSVTLFIIVPIYFMRVPDGSVPVVGKLLLPKKFRFPYLIGVTLVLIAVVIITVVTEEFVSEDTKIIFSVVLCLIGLAPWLLIVPARGAGTDPVLEDQMALQNEEAQFVQPPSPWACGPGLMLRHPAALMLWFVIFSLQAGGLVLNTNLGQITSSRDGPHVSSATANALFSAAQSFGRLTGGFLSDVIVTKHWARPWYFTFLLGCMALGHAALCVSGPLPLYVGVLLIGYAFGSQYPVMIISITELFGAARIASNYMVFDGMPGALASLLIAKYLSTWIYESHITSGKLCKGDECYTEVYETMIGLCVVASCCAALLGMRAKEVYIKSVWAEPVPKTSFPPTNETS